MEREPDHVGRIMAQWHSECPGLDVSPMAVIGRLNRLSLQITDELVAVYAEFGLGEGDFDVLATLRRAGTPYELTPSGLADTTMVTSGAISKRVDRLAERGLVTRRVSDADARGRVIALTPAGKDLIERAFEAHLENERRLLAGLTELERTRLAHLLENWGRSLYGA
jgi:DNA-binding MarR family transcriptional regulator